MYTKLLLMAVILFSVNSFSQQKFADDLDSLFLKNGDIKIGEVKFGKKNIEFCSDRKNCVDYNFSEVEAYVKGHNKELKKARAKKNMPLKYEKRTILQSGDKEFVYAVLEHSGNKYDFYYQIITKLVGNKYRTFVHVVITQSNEKNIIAWYRRRGLLIDTVENAHALFKNTINKCQRLEDLNDKSNKELKETDYNLHEIVDGCDLTVKT